MSLLFWREFVILFIAALLGGAAVIPYSLKLAKAAGKNKPLNMSGPKLFLLATLQTGVIFFIVIAAGLILSHAIGLGALFVEALASGKTVEAILPHLLSAAVLGAGAGLLMLIIDLVFLPWLPRQLVDSSRITLLWENFAASFYGGLNEEFLMRLFGFSLVAWLLSKIWHTSTGLPTVTVFWAANITMAAIFGLGHLPATKKLVEKITPFLIFRALLLNGIIGLLCGWYFWHYGLEAAVLAHFAADIIYHVIGTIVLRLNDKYHFRQAT